MEILFIIIALLVVLVLWNVRIVPQAHEYVV